MEVLVGDNLINIKSISVQNGTSSTLKLGLINIQSLTSKAALVNELTDNHIEIFFLTETRLKPDKYLALNESTPPSHVKCHMTHSTGRGCGVATIFHANLGISPGPEFKFNLSSLDSSYTPKLENHPFGHSCVTWPLH